jgi:hypothetical protein
MLLLTIRLIFRLDIEYICESLRFTNFGGPYRSRAKQ